jgi:Icc-related predicted phosphoesterase
MRIVYVVDVHDRTELVADAVAAAGPIELLIVGGDITTGGTPEDAKHAIHQWLPLTPKLLAVAGNMDSAAIDAQLAELEVSLDRRAITVHGVGIYGVSAAPHSHLQTPYELSEDELAGRIDIAFDQLEASRLRIFCPHAPPHGTACDQLGNGQHVGSTAVRNHIEATQPNLVLCGHIHEARKTDHIGESKIVNPGPLMRGYYAVVDVDADLQVVASHVEVA